jgi:hypothetical protein
LTESDTGGLSRNMAGKVGNVRSRGQNGSAGDRL